MEIALGGHFRHLLLYYTIGGTWNTSIFQWISYCIPALPEVKIYFISLSLSRSISIFLPPFSLQML